MIYKSSTSSTTFLPDDESLALLDKGLIDSGTNCNIAPKGLLEKFGYVATKLIFPQEIEFGNGTVTFSHFCYDVGGWVGPVYLVDTAPRLCFSIRYLEDRGYHISCRKLVCTIRDPNDIIVHSTPRCPVTFMYYADIPPHVPSAFTCSGASRRHHVCPALIERVMDLHRRLGHPSRTVMDKAIREGAWTGIDNIMPADITQVFRRRDCIECSLAKLNHVPMGEGSGIRPTLPRHTISLDWKPISPVGIGGYKGFFVFACCACYFLHLGLCRMHK